MGSVGLIDVDGRHYPNLALMKISAWHKAKGDDVEWCLPIKQYDIVYQSKQIRDLQRWVNNKFIFRSCERFDDSKNKNACGLK